MAIALALATIIIFAISIIDDAMDRKDSEETVEYAPGKFIQVGGRK